MFDTTAFWAVFAAVLLAAQLIPPEAERWRAALLAAAGVFVALEVIQLPPSLVGLLLAAVGWILVGLRLGLRAGGAGAREHPVRTGLRVFAPVLGLWVLGKQSTAVEGPLSWLYFAGFSYFLVKSWTLIKDSFDGRIEQAPPLSVAAYFLHFPTYLSGPMHYFGEFRTALRKPLRLDAEGWLEVGYRAALGLLKVELLAPLLQPSSLLGVEDPAALGIGGLALASVSYWGVLYFDFSGYCDLAIATSRALGVAAPENFNRPYLALNVRDFWQRWHISFTRALTAYLFLPSTRFLQARGFSRSTVTAGGYLVAFGFCGYWHGPTWNFVAWGLYHALGLIVYDRFRNWTMQRRRERGPAPPAPTRALLMRCAGVAATFGFVAGGWILFALPPDAFFGGPR